MTQQAFLYSPRAGDPAPLFTQRSPSNPQFVFSSAGGRYLVLCFFGSASDKHAQAALGAMMKRTDLFDDHKCSFFGVSNDERDESLQRVQNRTPGYRFFWDFDLSVAKLYGAIAPDTVPQSSSLPISRFWIITDPALRVISHIPFYPDGRDIQQVQDVLDQLPPVDTYSGIALQAPVLYLPRVLEPEMCRHMVEMYERHGGRESGFMREIDGRTVEVSDKQHKQRSDYTINDQELIRNIQSRFRRRIVPEILKAHQFHVTRMERYIISRYSAEDGGHFAAHRDNTTKGTAHRRFAVSINLNDDFDGGEVLFPEYSMRGMKIPTGGAVVFSCSLLHKVNRVTRGNRYAFLPFLYDEPAARIREQNAPFLGAAPAEDQDIAPVTAQD